MNDRHHKQWLLKVIPFKVGSRDLRGIVDMLARISGHRLIESGSKPGASAHNKFSLLDGYYQAVARSPACSLVLRRTFRPSRSALWQ